MRCPKCGYNSFDHNLLCPKCRKDLTATRRLLNLTVPVPGPINFFLPAGQAVAFEEPLGEAATFGDQSASALSAAGAFIAGSATSFDPSPVLGDQLPEGQVFSTEPALEDIMPLADNYETIANIQPIDSNDAPGNIVDIEPDFEAMPLDIDQVVGAEEIEIDTLDDAMVEQVEIAPAPTIGQMAALDQIRNTLAETGDLAAAPPSDVEFQDRDLTEESPAENNIPGDLEIDDLEFDDLEESVIGDIDDSDILEADFNEEGFDQPIGAVSGEVDSEDLTSDIFDGSTVETESAPSTTSENPPPFQAEANLEGLAGETESSPVSAEAGDGPMDEMAIDMEVNLDDLEEKITAEEIPAENFQASQTVLETKEAPADDKKRPAFPSAVPKIPARAFGPVSTEASRDTSKTDAGSLESDDLSSLVDEINLDDLDSEL